jgi:hypothetical protein
MERQIQASHAHFSICAGRRKGGCGTPVPGAKSATSGVFWAEKRQKVAFFAGCVYWLVHGAFLQMIDCVVFTQKIRTRKRHFGVGGVGVEGGAWGFWGLKRPILDCHESIVHESAN